MDNKVYKLNFLNKINYIIQFIFNVLALKYKNIEDSQKCNKADVYNKNKKF